MSKVYTAKEICERALRAINAFPVTESAADGEHLREAMIWLDLIMAQESGTQKLFSRIPQTLTIALTNGTGTYALYDALGADLPPDRVQFPVMAWLEDTAGNRTPIEIVTRDRFETFEATRKGPPEIVHIDRMPTPTLRINPVPDAGDPKTYLLKLVVQMYAPNVAPGGVTGTQPSGSILHDFRQAAQRWLVLQLAHDLGSGPIFKIGESSLNRFEKQAMLAKQALDAFENREHETTPPICEPWGM